MKEIITEEKKRENAPIRLETNTVLRIWKVTMPCFPIRK